MILFLASLAVVLWVFTLVMFYIHVREADKRMMALEEMSHPTVPTVHYEDFMAHTHKGSKQVGGETSLPRVFGDVDKAETHEDRASEKR